MPWIAVVAFACGLAAGVVYGGMFCRRCDLRDQAEARGLYEKHKMEAQAAREAQTFFLEQAAADRAARRKSSLTSDTALP